MEIDPRDAMSRDEVLNAWGRAKADLEHVKQKEMDWRKYVVARAFSNPDEGTNKFDLGDGRTLKATIKYNYNLDPDIDKIEKALDDISKMGNEGSFIADRIVKWEATFLLTEYRALCDSDLTEIQRKIKRRIDDILTITEAAPTVNIIEPKHKK